MFDRNKFAEELILRENIRNVIRIVENKKTNTKSKLQEDEKQLRAIIKDLIVEAKKIAIYDSTGKNELNVFLLNTSFLSTIETSYLKLTTSFDQRKSYIKHMAVYVIDLLNRLDSLEDDDYVSKVEGPTPEPEEVENKIKIDVGDQEPEFHTEEPKQTEEPTSKLTDLIGSADEVFSDFLSSSDMDWIRKEFEGKVDGDLTGAKNAYEDFSNSETLIRGAYSKLDDPRDEMDFKLELPKQILLHGREYEATLAAQIKDSSSGIEDVESELGGGTPEPMPGVAGGVPTTKGSPELETGTDLDGADEFELEDEDELEDIKLEEVLKHLDIDDILRNLL